jgi:sulfonate transport system substrate-binding protein
LSQSPSHVLANGEGLGLSGPVYSARREYARDNGAFIHDLLDELTAAEALTRSQREDSLNVLTDFMGLPVDVVARYMDNRPPSPILPIDDKIIEAQQATADLFFQNRLLPKAIEVKKAVWNSQAN